MSELKSSRDSASAQEVVGEHEVQFFSKQVPPRDATSKGCDLHETNHHANLAAGIMIQ
jgi:hypothetical protein